jgi:hypothetical protein
MLSNQNTTSSHEIFSNFGEISQDQKSIFHQILKMEQIFLCRSDARQVLGIFPFIDNLV